jgi:hypothetical protein
MKTTTGILAILACAGIATASTSFTPSPTLVDSFTVNNIASIDGQGDVDNITATWNNLGSGTVDQIRVVGTLTEVNTGTFASEARVRFSPLNNNTFAPFNVQATTVGGYVGSLAIDNTINVPSFNLVPDSVGIEWFESFQDGAAGLAESVWDTVTYEFLQSAGPTVITNGNFALGAISTVAAHSGSHVSGGLDFFTFSIGAVANPGDSLSISMTAGLTGTSMTDTEIALYDGAGNLVASNDDAIGLFSALSFDDLSPLAAGNYTLVTGGYNTVFPATLDGTFVPGTNAGTYELAIAYVPTPGALALLGMGGLIANRRRR